MFYLFKKSRKNSKTFPDEYYPDFAALDCPTPIWKRKEIVMSGIAMGDLAGSRYEGIMLPEGKTPESVELYGKGHSLTDDTILSMAILSATEHILDEEVLDENDRIDIYRNFLKLYTLWNPEAGYGGQFFRWAMDEDDLEPYNSCGNGSAMRAGIIGACFDDVEDVITFARLSALPTHNHKEGIRGAVVSAVCVWLLLHGADKKDIKKYLLQNYPSIENQRPNSGCKPIRINGTTSLKELIQYGEIFETLSVLCQVTVPEAAINYVESDSLESCLRNSMRYLCDRDTVGAISGGMAAAYYGVEEKIDGLFIKDILKDEYSKIDRFDVPNIDYLSKPRHCH